jgi:hypothetical protein
MFTDYSVNANGVLSPGNVKRVHKTSTLQELKGSNWAQLS